MKNLALGALIVGLMACGGGSTTTGDVMIIDASGDSGVPPTCNPLTQTGCDAGQKCTWIWDQLMPTPRVGHVGCQADGTVAVNQACGAAMLGGDTCAKGSFCLSGVCKQICDNQGGAPMCGSDYSCAQYSGVFVTGGTTVAGVCDPGCDPLTQDLKVGTNKTACGSMTPTAPTFGCYGYDDYSCSGAGDLMATNRTPPPDMFLNSCAPGYMPFLIESTGSTAGICSGFCAALETDNRTAVLPGETTAHNVNGVGSTTALAKLPTKAGPVAGDATCGITKKGSAGSVCKFLWPYQQATDGTFAASYMPYLDTLGVCFEPAHYTYDDGVPPADPIQYPNCANLPPNSAATPSNFDDASDWGCQKFANTPAFAGKSKLQTMSPAMRDIRLPDKGTAMYRHVVD